MAKSKKSPDVLIKEVPRFNVAPEYEPKAEPEQANGTKKKSISSEIDDWGRFNKLTGYKPKIPKILKYRPKLRYQNSLFRLDQNSILGILFTFMAVVLISNFLVNTYSDSPSNEGEIVIETELDEWQVHFAASVSDLPDCTQNASGWLYYIESNEGFQVCTSNGWEAIDLTGPQGQEGAKGSSGMAGQSAPLLLVQVTNSSTCENGGNLFEIGNDVDGDNSLSNSEISVAVDICNGGDGISGQDGIPGMNGTDGADGENVTNGSNGINGLNALITTTPEAAGSNCANGGVRIDVGVDQNSDSNLSVSEIDQTQFVCNANGASSNSTLINTITVTSPSLMCDAGGRVLSYGLDNGDGGGVFSNGILENGEIDYTTTFCSTVISNDQNVRNVKDIASGSLNSNPDALTAVGTSVYFSASDGTHGIELWSSDGSDGGTVMVSDINTGAGDSYPQNLVAVGTTLYFSADDNVNGRELWKFQTQIDIGPSNPSLVKDININGSGNPLSNQYTAVVGSTLFFCANDGINGQELWKTSGNASDTSMVKDIGLGASSGLVKYLTTAGTSVFFQASDAANGAELWVSDGTSSGTNIVKDIRAGGGSSSPTELTEMGGNVYFEANDGSLGNELWTSDGTVAGTAMVSDICSGCSSNPSYLTSVGSSLYFQATNWALGYELWMTDGTDNGTVLVKDINSGNSSSYPNQYTAIGNKIYFSVDDGTNGMELWVSDGTSSGTALVADINSGSGWSNITQITVIGNRFYFIADDSITGVEVWVSDGTTAGTHILKDIMFGPTTSSPLQITAVSNALFFTASDGTNGNELFTNFEIYTSVTYS